MYMAGPQHIRDGSHWRLDAGSAPPSLVRNALAASVRTEDRIATRTTTSAGASPARAVSDLGGLVCGLSHLVTDTLTHGKPMTSSEAHLSCPST